MAERARVRLLTPIEGLGAPLPMPWNRTWLKRNATLLAENDSPSREPLIARWRIGSGQVLAAAYPVAGADALARLVAAAPRDPRFRVTWKTGGNPRVFIEATDSGRAMNGMVFTLDTIDLSGRTISTQTLVQTSPGYYEAMLDSPSEPVFAVLRQEKAHLLDRVALPQRYASEFDAIGIDADALKRLAAQSGGAVIPPAQTSRIRLASPTDRVALSALLAAAGGLCLVAGLIRWRVS